MMKNLLLTALFAFSIGWLAAQTDILPPQLVKPLNEEQNQMPDVVLDWYAVSGIGEIIYTLHLDVDESFSDPVAFETNFTSVQMTNLLFGQVYFWRVKAADDTGESEWSDIFSFRVFDMMSINSPDEGEIDRMPNVKLSWRNTISGKAISGLTHIQVQVDTLNFWNSLSQSVTDENLTDASFTSTENGYVVGEGGTILFFNRMMWTEQESPVNADLNAVSFINDTTGWAVGTGGTIIFKMDSGDWMEQENPLEDDIFDIYMMPDATGFAVGEGGHIIWYNGSEWTEQTSNTTSDLFAVFYVDDMNWWAAGEGGTILHYDGNEWTEQDSPVSRDFFDISFVDASNGWICGENGSIVYYNGEEWVEQDSDINDDLYFIVMDNTESGFAGGEVDDQNMIQFDGEIWFISTTGTLINLNGVFKLDDDHAWVVGDEGTILYKDPNGFSSPVSQIYSRELDDSTSIRTAQLYFGKKYYWRVRGVHDDDQSKWSASASFTTIEKVNHISPEDGASDQMIDVFVEWQPITGSFEYIYELCLDPDFNVPCMSFTDTNAISPPGLMFGNTYYWRVKAAHLKDTTEWSDAWSFETINTVYLDSPGNGDTIADPLPKLEWNALTGVEGYEIQYNDSDDFSDVETYEESDASYNVQFQLEAGKTYYWRVRAFEDGDTTQWSDVWHFLLGTQSIDDLVLNKHNLNIYPNPANEELNIELNAIESRNIDITVIDLLGEEIYKLNKRFNQGINIEKIDLSDFNDGLYFIRLQSGDATITDKIVIRK